MRLSLLFILLIMFSGCNNIPKDVKKVLAQSGENRNELEKVIEHYVATKQDQKLQAAYFLIGNMTYKYGINYSPNSKFFQVLPIVDSLYKANASMDKINSTISAFANEISRDELIISKELIQDKDCITSEYLIENIDLAFKAWKEFPWARHVGFENFCEMILPYRILDEPIQNWRGFMMDQLSWLKDSLQNPSDVEEACLKVNEFIARDFLFSAKLDFLPALGGVDSWNNKQGLCLQRYQLITMAMRSVGIPVTIDFTPQFLRRTAEGHEWTVLLSNDGEIKSFNGGEKWAWIREELCNPIHQFWIAEGTTFYRYYYSEDKNPLFSSLDWKELPENLQLPNIKEVSSQYQANNLADITFNIDIPKKNVPVFLFAFGQGTDLKALTYSIPSREKVTFPAIGKGGAYVAGTFENGKPIVLTETQITYYNSNPNKFVQFDTTITQNVKLYRKYPYKPSMKPFIDGMIGAKLQGANQKDFSDSVTIYRISEFIDYYKTIGLEYSEKYRYYRYISSDSSIRIADITLIGDDGINHTTERSKSIFGYKSIKGSDDECSFENAFDDNIRTNFNAPKGSWVAVDLKKPANLSAFKILARNHLNIVEPENKYELLYFDKEWKSLGKKIADDYYIEFEKVPLHAILILRNLSKGEEERIFRYWNGDQIWL